MVPDARSDARIFSGLLKWALMHRDVPYTSVELFWYSAFQNLFLFHFDAARDLHFRLVLSAFSINCADSDGSQVSSCVVTGRRVGKYCFPKGFNGSRCDLMLHHITI